MIFMKKFMHIIFFSFSEASCHIFYIITILILNKIFSVNFVKGMVTSNEQG